MTPGEGASRYAFAATPRSPPPLARDRPASDPAAVRCLTRLQQMETRDSPLAEFIILDLNRFRRSVFSYLSRGNGGD